MPVENVLEVADLGQVRAVPGARPEVLGVRNRRGQILPVVDLARLLGIARPGPPSRLLVAEARGCQAGFAIDEVSWVASAIWPSWRSSGVATADAMVSGLAPGSEA